MCSALPCYLNTSKVIKRFQWHEPVGRGPAGSQHLILVDFQSQDMEHGARRGALEIKEKVCFLNKTPDFKERPGKPSLGHLDRNSVLRFRLTGKTSSGKRSQLQRRSAVIASFFLPRPPPGLIGRRWDAAKRSPFLPSCPLDYRVLTRRS